MTLALPRLTAAALCAAFALALPLAAQETATPQTEAAPEGPVNSGAYLAARSAEAHGDFRTAAGWFDQSLQADPTNTALMDGSIFAHLNLGNLDTAAQLSAQLRDLDGKSDLADFALIAHDAQTENYEALIERLRAGDSVGPLVDQLTLAWAEVGAGRMSEALAHFDEMARNRGFEAYALYHKALALALAGDFEGADHILSGKAAGPINLNRRGVIALVQILSQLERNDEALALLDKAFGNDPEPQAEALRARLRAGESIPFDTARSAREGIAEVFFTLATLLNGESDPALVLMNSRTALVLKPDHTEALLLTAATLEQLQQYDLAVEVYATLPADNPAYYSAELGRADALYAAGRKDAAVEVLQSLVRSHGNLIGVQAALADMLRREDRWQEALSAYDAALALAPQPAREHWLLFFSRGICAERLGRFDASDADFRRALELNPGQPQVLNYLGYSLVERGRDLDEALKMIEQAVAAQPDAGYIIDSLAWAYFQLGRYQDALAPMEKASLLEPVDPVVTDHLGDVYWMNGRQREAEFQWHRALSFGPEEKDAVRIRKKLDQGLEAVLAAEGTSKPPAVSSAENGN